MIGFLTVAFVIYLIFVVSINFSVTYQTFCISVIALSSIALIIYIILKKKKVVFGFHIRHNITKTSSQETLQFMPMVYFFIVLSFLLIYWLGEFPGGFNLDACGQWLQAHNLMQYNNWHPFVSTLLIQLILQVYDSFTFYMATQIFFFSIAISYLLSSIQRQGINHKVLIILAIYIGINPCIGLNTICMTKDVQFAILTILLTGVLIRIIATRGEWLKRIIHLIVLSVLSILIALVRHNGILFIIPTFLVLGMTVNIMRRKIIISFLSIIIALGIIRWPILNTLNVQKHENVLGEMAGIPMGMMANALIMDEENLPVDVHSFLNTIATDDEWNNHYITGEWDSCKWEFGGIELLKNCSVSDLLNYTIATIYSCPQACYEAFRENTKLVWSPFIMSSSWVPYVYVEENEFNIRSLPIAFFHEVSAFLVSISQIPLISYIFWNYGFLFIVLLAFWLMQDKYRKQRSVLPLLSLFVYSTGTMLLLSGPNQRYIYFGMVLILPAILFLLSGNPKELQKS